MATAAFMRHSPFWGAPAATLRPIGVHGDEAMSCQPEKFSAHVRSFSELMIRLRSEVGNDLDLVLILAVIIERYYAAIAASEGSAAADPATALERYDINALSVALYAGIRNGDDAVVTAFPSARLGDHG